MGDACEEWILCDLGAQAAGAISYGIYPTASATEVEYQMKDGGAAIFVAENQEYVDKILPYADTLPGLRWIVVVDDSAMFAYDHPKLKSFAQLMELGGDAGIESLERLARRARPGCGRVHRLHLGHFRSAQGRADLAWRAPRGDGELRRALPDARRTRAPNGRLPAAVPHLRARHRGVAAAAVAHGAALRRGARGPAADLLRSGADRAVHRPALPAEVRLAGAGRHRRHVAR